MKSVGTWLKTLPAELRLRFKARLLRFYLRWTPDLKQSVATEGPGTNYIFVHADGGNPEIDNRSATVGSVEKGQIRCVYFTKSNEKRDVSFAYTDFFEMPIFIRYSRPRISLRYDSFYEPFFDLIGGIQLREFRRWLIDRRLDTVDDQMRVLRHAVELVKPQFAVEPTPLEEVLTGQMSIRLDKLLASIYGDAIGYSDKYFAYRKYLEFQVRGLISSGDLDEAMGGTGNLNQIQVNPSAINTLARHELEMKKFRDAQRPVKWLVFLTLVYVLATIALVWLGWYQFTHPQAGAG